MASFIVSAPGKIILFGEHAVVYGKTAVAASLDLRSRLKFRELLMTNDHIHVLMPKLGIDQEVSLKKIQDYFSVDKCPQLVNDHEKFVEYVTKFVELLNPSNAQQKISFQAFFYVLIQVFQKNGLLLKPFEIYIDTDLSISSGLGSSASFSVCLAACFLHWHKLQSGKTSSKELDSSQLNEISRYAYNCEKIMHGQPSGIDNTVCTFGSIIEFRRGSGFVPIPGAKILRVLLVDTKVERSTKALVDRLALLKSNYPRIFDPLLESFDGVSKETLNIIRKLQSLPEDEFQAQEEAYKELMVLMDINQGLLSTSQVSHQSLDSICTTVKKYGLAAKLTGAGGGGYAYVLLLPDTPTSTINSLSLELIANGYLVTQTNLGGSGVEIHD